MFSQVHERQGEALSSRYVVVEGDFCISRRYFLRHTRVPQRSMRALGALIDRAYHEAEVSPTM